MPPRHTPLFADEQFSRPPPPFVYFLLRSAKEARRRDERSATAYYPRDVGRSRPTGAECCPIRHAGRTSVGGKCSTRLRCHNASVQIAETSSNSCSRTTTHNTYPTDEAACSVFCSCRQMTSEISSHAARHSADCLLSSPWHCRPATDMSARSRREHQHCFRDAEADKESSTARYAFFRHRRPALMVSAAFRVKQRYVASDKRDACERYDARAE